MIIIIDQNVTQYSQRSSSFDRSRNSAKSTPKAPKVPKKIKFNDRCKKKYLL